MVIVVHRTHNLSEGRLYIQAEKAMSIAARWQ